jgi:tetratricopeptide (TPR) repeat protein
MSLDFEEAEKLYRRLIDISPDRADSYIAFAQMLLNMGRYDEAIDMCMHAVDLDVEAYNSLTYSYIWIGDFDSAMWAANKYLESGKDKFNAYDSRGDTFATFGMFDSAVVSYTKAMELKPDFAISALKTGIVYMFLRQYDKVDSLFGTAAKSPEKMLRTYGRFYPAKALSYQGKFKAALERFDQLKAERRGDFGDDFGPLMGSYWRAFIFHEILEMYDSAITEYENVIIELEVTEDLPPNNFLFHMSRSGIGHCYAMLGYFDKADEVVQQFRADFNKYGPSANFYEWLLTGRIEPARGNIDGAIASMEKVVQYYPDYQDWLILARCYANAGRPYDAIRVYERIVNRYEPIDRGFFSSLSVLTHYELGLAYESVGSFDDAIEQYTTFLNIWRDADEGLEVVEDAKQRLARLQHGT